MFSIFQKKIRIKDFVKYSATFAEKMSEAIANRQTKIDNVIETKRQFYKAKYNEKMKKRKWEYDTNRKEVDNTNGEVNDEKRVRIGERIKLRKYGILMGYSGVGYFGMQRNPGMKTIEEELLTAMLKNKWINQEAFDQSQVISFQRAARTDKGVSAARQCVSLKLPDSINVESLNKDLPPEIRVYAVKRVTKGFNSKDKCNARTYAYTIPTVAFAEHNDKTISIKEYRIPPEKITKVNEILKLFQGTNNYHNFTSRRESFDPSSKRYILSFQCGESFLDKNNIEYVTMKVKGQSFVLHQIRKMIGLVVAIVRGLTSIDTINKAFSEECIDIPKAPGLGLVLDFVHYERYNTRYSDDGFHSPLDWNDEQSEIEKFSKDFIYSNIYETELKENSTVNWLETLPLHSYDVRDNSSKEGNIKSESNIED